MLTKITRHVSNNMLAAEAGSDTETSKSSSDEQPTTSAASSRIARISTARKYKQQAMARAKHLGLSKNDDSQVADLTVSLRHIEEVEPVVEPTHAYRLFMSCPGTRLPHIQTFIDDYRQTYSPFVQATTRLQLTLARDALRAKRALVGPDPANPYAAIWSFNNDLHDTAPSSLAAMDMATGPDVGTQIAATNQGAANAIDFSQLELPGPSRIGANLKQGHKSGVSSSANGNLVSIPQESTPKVSHKRKKETKRPKGLKKKHKKRKSESRHDQKLKTRNMGKPMNIYSDEDQPIPRLTNNRIGLY